MLSRTPTEELKIINAHIEAATEDFAQANNLLKYLQTHKLDGQTISAQLQNALGQAQARLSRLEQCVQSLIRLRSGQE
jgi:outer membrane PBP1 activator LpoA protein